MSNTTAFRSGAVVFAVAVAINFVWEMAQSFLFAPMGNAWEGTWRCLRASVGDAVVIVGLFAIGCVLFRRRLWIVQSGVAAYVFLIVAGVSIAIAMESLAVRQGWWANRAQMPTLPGLGVGLVPLLQMAILPVVVLRLTAAWELRHR